MVTRYKQDEKEVLFFLNISSIESHCVVAAISLTIECGTAKIHRVGQRLNVPLFEMLFTF